VNRVKTLSVRLGAALVIAGAGLLGTAANASAASVIYSAQTSSAPNSNALQNMAHQNAYTWELEGINLGNNTITQATLTFNGFYNWTDYSVDKYNILWVDLLDKASTTGNGAIGTFVGDDTNGGTLGVNDVKDCFRFVGGTNVSCASLISSTQTSHTYFGSSINTNDNGVTGYGNAAGTTANNFGLAGTDPASGAFGQTHVTWSITTTNSAILNSLAQYIANGKDIAFGLDSDCHFGDTNITFQIWGTPNVQQQAAVPEPATMLLVGSGLFAAYRRRRLSA